MKNPVILLGDNSLKESQVFFNKFLKEKIFILVDANSEKYCLDIFFKFFPSIKNSIILKINNGESSKNLDTVSSLINQLIKYRAEKKSLFINLGGGVVSDLGGFLASIFNRGINYVNVPTTLLSQVDASIGGKTAVNFNNIKNKVGSFNNPILVLILPIFLKTLPRIEIISGFGEIFKYSLISDPDLWRILKKNKIKLSNDIENLIFRSVSIKKMIIRKDFFDDNVRKKLNFGHTIGHAIESAHVNESRFNHGICVVIGMICESYISNKLNYLSDTIFNEIHFNLISNFSLPKVINIERVLSYIKSDKKNIENHIQMVAISKIGKAHYDVSVDEYDIKQSLIFFNSINV